MDGQTRFSEGAGLDRFWHLGADSLWLLNGLIFYILIFSTGHWQRLVPTSWDYVPNAISVGLQYLSLDWPSEMGWTAYNALQLGGIEFVRHFSELGGGRGGYNQDHEFFGYRHAI